MRPYFSLFKANNPVIPLTKARKYGMLLGQVKGDPYNLETKMVALQQPSRRALRRGKKYESIQEYQGVVHHRARQEGGRFHSSFLHVLGSHGATGQRTDLHFEHLAAVVERASIIRRMSCASPPKCRPSILVSKYFLQITQNKNLQIRRFFVLNFSKSSFIFYQRSPVLQPKLDCFLNIF